VLEGEAAVEQHFPQQPVSAFLHLRDTAPVILGTPAATEFGLDVIAQIHALQASRLSRRVCTLYTESRSYNCQIE